MFARSRLRLPPALAAAALLTAAAVFAPGCSRDAAPCVVLIITDTTRADALGCYGAVDAGTATLDSLARTGVRFAQAVTHVPVTAPSITTILSGTLPPAHGVRDNGRFTVHEDLVLLPEVFRDAGWRTAGVAAAVPLLGRFGYARGCEVYDDDFASDPYPVHDPRLAAQADDLRRSERRAGPVTDRALAWLEGVPRGDAAFLLVHYFDPHHPYDPPPAYAARHPGRPYAAEVAYMDAEIGRLLDGVRRARGPEADVRVVVAGDHGESLGQHEEADHGFFLYDTTLRVPLIFSGPGARPGLAAPGAVRLVDVARTVCDWLGLDTPPSMGGASLLPALGGGAAPAACDTALIETFLTQLHYDWSPLMGVRTSQAKWVKAPRPELYDLIADPGEVRNLIAERPDEAAAWSAAHDRLLAEARRGFARWGARPAGADPDLDRRLRSLGYAAGSSRGPVEPDWSLPDPKDGNRRFNQRQARQALLAEASLAARDGRADEALGLVEKAAAIDTLRGREAAFQAHLLARLERWSEALPLHRQALRGPLAPADEARARLGLAETLAMLQDVGAARSELDLLEAQPGLPADVAAGAAELRRRLAGEDR
jgi:choline-sulfatase